MNVKKNDTVVVLSGKDKGKKGKVLEAMPATGKVVVEGINIATPNPSCPCTSATASSHRTAHPPPSVSPSCADGK